MTLLKPPESFEMILCSVKHRGASITQQLLNYNIFMETLIDSTIF